MLHNPNGPNTMTTHRNRNANLTPVQIIAINNELMALLEKLSDGSCRYKSSDDAHVAQKHGVTLNQVQRLRQKLFGELRREKPGSISNRLDTLEARLTCIEDYIPRLSEFRKG